MRTIKNIYPAVYSPVADLITYRALPTQYVEYIDPFLFLNHHGPQVYGKNNHGLPFGPHPHRGMETVTFIIDGDIAHRDSNGHESVIKSGGVQWMRAGRGLIHAEVSSDEFKRDGGELEILQLWINLPARLKTSDPFYIGKQQQDIPTMELDNGRIRVQVISGAWEQTEGAFHSDTGISLNLIHFASGTELDIHVPQNHQIFFYVVRGELSVNNEKVKKLHLAEFNQDDTNIKITSMDDSILLLGHAEPLNEPVVSQGPFVMNTQQEIAQAYEDYRNGKFGSWSN